MSLPSVAPQWFCAQIGAREHYAVARALQQDGKLAALYTDFWAGPLTQAVSGKSNLKPFRALAARHHPELEKSEVGNQKSAVISWNWRALLWERALRQKTVRQTPYHGFIEVGHRFATRVRENLKCREDLLSGSIFYAYDTGALEAFEWCHGRGIKCVLNQMDPNRVEMDIVREEEKLWPGWALQSMQVPEEYCVRREQEWALADRVVVNSEFSRQALLQQGVPSEKLVVIPLCYELGEVNRKPEIEARKPGDPLRILFLGQVILRKGIQYLIGAAKLLEKENVHFDVVGPIGISREAMATAPRNVTFHGRIGRDQTAACYRRSHVFVLPTISDGFAITQLEAMAHGLPVVTTPNCGEVVGDGVDGWVVPARDARMLAQALGRYLAQPELLQAHSSAALGKAGQFTLQRLADNLSRLEVALNLSNV